MTGDPSPSQDVLRALLSGIAAADTGIALFDPEDRYIFGSPAFKDFLDVQPGEQTYSSMMRHCHRTERGIAIPNPDVEAWIAAALRKRRVTPLRTLEKDLYDGRWLRITETTFDGGWVLNTLHDITDLKSHEMAMRDARDAARAAAETDVLTGLANRSAVMARFEVLVGEASGGDMPLSIGLIDLDHFKQINDRFGHDAGDCVLTDFGHLARNAVRTDDVLGRVGGEEFLLLMKQTPRSAAVEVLHSVRMRVERSRPMPGRHLRYTMSAGLAVLQDGESASDFYGRTDRLLYDAKRKGRNCVVSDEECNQVRLAG